MVFSFSLLCSEFGGECWECETTLIYRWDETHYDYGENLEQNDFHVKNNPLIKKI